MAAPDSDGDHGEGDVELGSGNTLRKRVASVSGDESARFVSKMRE
jgi:hypothetical protein